jgi:rSAM/selenodomain-associated transferase 1
MILDLFHNIEGEKRRVTVYYDGDDPVFPDVVDGFDIKRQVGGDLGSRMYNAFADVFAQSAETGVERAVLIGSDIPYIDARLLREYLDELYGNRVVLGPSEDGGYYLIGFTREGLTGELFDDIEWSRENVLKRTLETARKMRIDVYLGPRLRDIDRLEDLRAVLGHEEWRTRAPRTAEVHSMYEYTREIGDRRENGQIRL